MRDGRRRLRARVIGRVQGVGFRWWTRAEAHRLGLTGWVRNEADERTVEVLAEGLQPQLDALEAWLHDGPPGAQVDRVETSREPASGEYQRFEIER